MPIGLIYHCPACEQETEFLPRGTEALVCQECRAEFVVMDSPPLGIVDDRPSIAELLIGMMGTGGISPRVRIEEKPEEYWRERFDKLDKPSRPYSNPKKLSRKERKKLKSKKQ